MLPFRSGRAQKVGAAGALLSFGILAFVASAADPKGKPKKERTPASLTNIPLPIGQEAKGLVLPDFDASGHLRTRIEAEKAKRTDAEHIQFGKLSMTTFNPQNTAELLIEMTTSTLDLNTHVITSAERTTIKRSDFHIEGDAMRFDTVAKKGTLTGNVKMLVTDPSDLKKKTVE